jgi:hypothetical protein
VLIYHPAFDAYHCVVRLLKVLAHIPNCELPRARIIDFFVVFPGSVSELRFPRGTSHIRALARQLSNPYHGPVNSKQTFREMEHIQLAAVRCLAGAGIIATDELQTGLLKRTDRTLPKEFAEISQHSLVPDKTLSAFLVETLGPMPLNGPDGLKDRSGFLEHRYDIS